MKLGIENIDQQWYDEFIKKSERSSLIQNMGPGDNSVYTEFKKSSV